MSTRVAEDDSGVPIDMEGSYHAVVLPCHVTQPLCDTSRSVTPAAL